jgi:hypothetical protein
VAVVSVYGTLKSDLAGFKLVVPIKSVFWRGNYSKSRLNRQLGSFRKSAVVSSSST